MANSISACLAVEDALHINLDINSTIMRNLIHGCKFLQNIEGFVRSVMLGNVEAIAKYYEDYLQNGGIDLKFLSFVLFD